MRISDWSSDVCSSDLIPHRRVQSASQMRRNRAPAKTATLPSLRVDPHLREAAEAVLEDNESLSTFIEDSVRAQIARRQAQRTFIERGLASRDHARNSGRYVPAKDRKGTRMKSRTSCA